LLLCSPDAGRRHYLERISPQLRLALSNQLQPRETCGVLSSVDRGAALLHLLTSLGSTRDFSLFQILGAKPQRDGLCLLFDVLFFYYIGWEFFFRGFIQLGTETAVGVPVSIMVQVIPSAIISFGKPGQHAQNR
jgi:hypothetical protein